MDQFVVDVDGELARQIAEDIVLSHVEDVEFLSVVEMTTDRVEVGDYTEEELEMLISVVDDLVRSAEVAVTFP